MQNIVIVVVEHEYEDKEEMVGAVQFLLESDTDIRRACLIVENDNTDSVVTIEGAKATGTIPDSVPAMIFDFSRMRQNQADTAPPLQWMRLGVEPFAFDKSGWPSLPDSSGMTLDARDDGWVVVLEERPLVAGWTPEGDPPPPWLAKWLDSVPPAETAGPGAVRAPEASSLPDLGQLVAREITRDTLGMEGELALPPVPVWAMLYHAMTCELGPVCTNDRLDEHTATLTGLSRLMGIEMAPGVPALDPAEAADLATFSQTFRDKLAMMSGTPIVLAGLGASDG